MSSTPDDAQPGAQTGAPTGAPTTGDGSPGVVELVREAWSQALVAVTSTEEDVQKFVSRVSGWVEMGPEEARRLGAELTEKLRTERSQLEAGIESAVKKALTPFRLPSRDEIAALQARIASIEARVDRLASRGLNGTR